MVNSWPLSRQEPICTEPLWGDPHENAEEANETPIVAEELKQRETPIARKSFRTDHSSAGDASQAHSHGQVGILKPLFANYQSVAKRRVAKRNQSHQGCVKMALLQGISGPALPRAGISRRFDTFIFLFILPKAPRNSSQACLARDPSTPRIQIASWQGMRQRAVSMRLSGNRIGVYIVDRRLIAV